MSVFRRLKNFFSSCATQLAQPAEDRPLFRLVLDGKIHHIVELGLSDLPRTVRLLETARRQAPAGIVRYTGIDPFELRDDSQAVLSLKDAHRQLKATGARVQLVPGNPFAALSRVANDLLGTQLLLVAAGAQGEALDRAWFYVPRILAADAKVMIERPDEKTGELVFQPLSQAEITQLARQYSPRRMAA